MEDQGKVEMNWTALFIVTACSSFLFSLTIKILDGEFPILLLVISAITGVLSLLSWFLKILNEQYLRKKSHNSFTADPTD
jgi:hypothetical protein